MSGMNLHEFLMSQNVEASVATVINGLFTACGKISEELRKQAVSTVGSKNEFGEEQLSVDILAENILTKFSEECKDVRAISSEENTLLRVNGSGSVIVCWDPLDGSSIIGSNWSVGSIFSIWEIGKNDLSWNGSETLIGRTGRQQVGALIFVYGSRTTALLSVGSGTFEFLLINSKVICLGKRVIEKSGASIFAPANLRAAQDLPGYRRLIDYWMSQRYTLRYSGGLVPDVFQLFVKGQGVFCNPRSMKCPAKLRLAYEVMPIAFLVENAQGRTSDGEKSLLDVALEKMDFRVPLCCGTAEEVLRFEEYIGSA